MQPVIAVIDIGKTNVKVSAVASGNTGGETVDERRQANAPLMHAPYPQVNHDAIWTFLTDSLKDLGARYYVESIAITTHGATAALIDDAGALVLPIPDYESDRFDEALDAYRALRPPFAETGSPELPAGLNLGKQIFWLRERFPDEFSRARNILMYPQYWGWRLSGVKAGDVTSLGCHTDLWCPSLHDYSSMARQLGWQELMPPLVPTGDILGPIAPDVVELTGLPPSCVVRNGIHDSNASLVPHLLSREEPFTVISSGTWTVICGVGASLEGLDETRDMLVNVNAFGTAVPTIRFMGGREWETLRSEREAEVGDLEAVLTQSVMALPSFADAGGPFQHREGKIIGPRDGLSPGGRSALAALYCALMTEYCLELLNNAGDVIVEGAFGGNPVYLGILAQLLRPKGVTVLVTGDVAGTTQGTSMLGQNINHWPMKQPSSVPAYEVAGLSEYRDRWRARL